MAPFARSTGAFSTTDVLDLTSIIWRIALDPTTAPARDSLEAALLELVTAPDSENISLRCGVYARLVDLFHTWPVAAHKAEVQVQALKCLPGLSPAARAIGGWFAWSCLVTKDMARELALNEDAFDEPPPVSAWTAALTLPAGQSAFDTSDGSSDSDLLHRAVLLTAGIAGFGEAMFEPGILEAERHRRRTEVEECADAVEVIEGKIRECPPVSSSH